MTARTGHARPWGRGLLRFLVLLLVPVIVVTLPQPGANAAVGPSASVEVSGGGWRWFDDWNCTVVAQWNTNSGFAVDSRATCSGEWDHALVGMDLNFSGSDADGNLCTASVSLGESNGDNGKWNGTLAGSGSISTDGEVETCRISEVCWQAIEDKLFQDPNVVEGCAVMDLGPMEDEKPPGCEYFSPQGSPTVEKILTGTGNNWFIRVQMPITYHSIWAGAGELNVLGVWRDQRSSSPGTFFRGWPGGSSNAQIVSYGTQTFSRGSINANSYGRLDQYQLVGIQYYLRGAVAGYETFDTSLPQEDGGVGDLGTTAPNNCFYYFGEKIAEDVNSDRDIPSGPVKNGTEPPGGGTGDPITDPPPPPVPGDESAGCDGFSFTDPTSWAGAGICVLVRLIARLLDAIGGVLELLGRIASLIGGLVQALLDGIAALFIPGDGFLEESLDGLQGAFDGTTPGNYVEAVSDFELPSGSSACSGMDVRFPTPAGEADFSFGNACSGTMATIAGVVRAVITVGLGIAALVACLKALGAGLGWRPGIGESA